MKLLIALFLFLSGVAYGQTNFRSVMVDTNGVVQRPTNFITTNGFVVVNSNGVVISPTNFSAANNLSTTLTNYQTTYWFGLNGLGAWQTAGVQPQTGIFNRSGGSPSGWGTGISVWTISRIGTNSSGAGIRLGSTAGTGGGAWNSSGGTMSMQAQVATLYAAMNAVSFQIARGNNTNFWGNSDETIGLFWVPQPTNSWTSSTAYNQHDKIAVSNVVWSVSTAGTTDTNQPTWTDLIGSLVTNGTAVFRNCGPHTSNNWVLARGSTNASAVIMTNTGKSTWLFQKQVRLNIRYATNDSTFRASVQDANGTSSEVSLPATNIVNALSPAFWQRWDGTNTTAEESALQIYYWTVNANLPGLGSP